MRTSDLSSTILHTLGSALPVAFAVLDREASFVFVSEAFAAAHGVPAGDLPGRPLAAALPALAPAIEPWLRRVLRDGETFVETPLAGDAAVPILGTLAPLRAENGAIVGALLIVPVPTLLGSSGDDPPHRLLAESARTERLESLARLAGGIAHDFNNLLTVVLTNAHFVREALSPGNPALADIEEIETASRRAATLTRQLLAFAQRQGGEARLVDLNAVAVGMDWTLRLMLGEDVALVTRLAANLHPVRIDPAQVEQLLANIVMNARDAMPKGGRITIETANVTIRPDVARGLNVKPGRFVLLTVTDSGVGMTSEIRERIFDPFFTTKEPGKGAGLGLAMCYGIVRQAGGHILAESEPGRGTAMRVYLPAAAIATLSAPPAPKSPPCSPS